VRLLVDLRLANLGLVYHIIFLTDALSDSARLLEQLLSKEVDDVSTQPQSVEQMRKALEEQGKIIEDQGSN